MWDDALNDEWETEELFNSQNLPVKKTISHQLPETAVGKYFYITPTLNKALSLKKSLDPSKSISEHICSALEKYLKDELKILKDISKQI